MTTSNIHTEIVSFSAEGGGHCAGFLARPGDDRAYPGVVVLQEWWGLDDHIKDVTQRFAAHGYLALAPDLYHGDITKDPVEARRLMQSLDMTQAARDTVGAINHLQALSNLKVGVVGFCLGGAVTWWAAGRSDAVGATVAFYPTSVPDEVLQTIRAPVLALYAELDTVVPPSQAKVVEEVLRGRALSVETHVYPGVDHAFFNDTEHRYDRPATEDAWNRMLTLFRRYLR